jgi:hypothetical protein
LGRAPEPARRPHRAAAAMVGLESPAAVAARRFAEKLADTAAPRPAPDKAAERLVPDTTPAAVAAGMGRSEYRPADGAAAGRQRY